MLRQAALITLITLFSFSSVYADYYDRNTRNALESGNQRNGELLDIIRQAANRNFRPLGYKKNAKKKLFGALHLERDGEGYFVRDVYCGFIVRNKVGPNRIPINNEMNTEHTWPQSKGSKREPARGDLHHLYPTNSRANSARGNHPFGEVRGEDATDECPLSQRGDIINPRTGNPSRTHGYQPPLEHRGNVARAMFYVVAKYNYRLSDLEEFYLRKWNRDDPVDNEEIKRNDGVQEHQGNRNPFIDFPDLPSRIADL